MSPEALRSMIRAAVLAMPLAGCVATPPAVVVMETEAEAEAAVEAEPADPIEAPTATTGGTGAPPTARAGDGTMDPDEFERRWRQGVRDAPPQAGPGGAVPLDLTMPGRPLMIDARARVAPLRISGRRVTRSLGLELPEEARAEVAATWASAGQAEHASVASFERAARELQAVGAPESLRRSHLESALQEREHAESAFSIAAAYGAPATDPDALPEATPRGGGLTRLVRDVLREGCVNETASALTAQRALRRARPAEVRRALEVAALEEAEHAALAFRTLRWAVSVDGRTRDVIEQEIETLLRPLPVARQSRWDLSEHGVLGVAGVLECRAAACERVVVPLLRAI